jgi:KDO2-lipid IV(A) lauroyltransferase
MTAWRFLAERSIINILQCAAAVTCWEGLPLVAKPMAKVLWLLLPKRRAITIDNLRQALKCNETEATELAQKVFHHVALTALEFLKMGANPKEALSRVRFCGWEDVEAVWRRHGRMIFVTGHMGNFELLGGAVAQRLPLWVVARPQSPASWQVIKSIREKVGMKVIDKFGSLREALLVLRSGGALGLLADQHAGDGAGTMIVSFFGRPASVFKTPALLAARTNSPLVFCYDVRLRDGTHEAVFLPPKFVSSDEVDDAVVWFCRELERAILRAPEQWWWLHDRWKIARRKLTAKNEP